MVSKDIQKLLVETEDKMERLKIIEDNQDMFDGEDSSTENPEMDTQLAEALAEIETQKQRYIDRFFGSSEENENPTDEEKSKDEEEPEPKTLEEILNNKGGK